MNGIVLFSSRIAIDGIHSSYERRAILYLNENGGDVYFERLLRGKRGGLSFHPAGFTMQELEEIFIKAKEEIRKAIP